MSRKKRAPAASSPPPPFHAPFAALDSLRESLPAGRERPLGRTAPAPPRRAVVRLERTGRRGKEVTVVEHLGLSLAQRLEWLSELRRTLGCGGALEDEALVLQGDHRARVAAYLRARGVGQVKGA